MPREIEFKIVLAPFPFDDLSSGKLRPALQLTRVMGVHRHVVLAYITSKTLSRFCPVTWFWTRTIPISL